VVDYELFKRNEKEKNAQKILASEDVTLLVVHIFLNYGPKSMEYRPYYYTETRVHPASRWLT
jgi:hypothetical protein